MRRTVKERLREVDANLLLSLHALLEERNLTHAGERMTMSQPAMSGALARLRKHFDDELLVRVGRGFELTPLAERLRPLVADAVEAAEALLGNQREFDPASSTRRFAVSMSEYAMTVLAEPLTRLLRRAGAGLLGGARPDRRRAGPVRDPADAARPDHRRRSASTSRAAPSRSSPTTWSAWSPGQPPAADGALTLDDLREMPHAVAEFGAAGERKPPARGRAGAARRRATARSWCR